MNIAPDGYESGSSPWDRGLNAKALWSRGVEAEGPKSWRRGAGDNVIKPFCPEFGNLCNKLQSLSQTSFSR